MIEINTVEEVNDKQVAIIGIGLRLPGNTKTPLQFWDNLIDGFDGIVETTERWSDTFYRNSEISSNKAGLLDLEEWKSFDPLFFGINPTDAKQIDPQIKMMLKTTWEAFEDASIDPLSIRGTDTSVFVGASSTDYLSFDCEPNESPINVFNSSLCAFSNRISYCFDLHGTSLTVDTACSSSLNAVHLGYETIINGKSDYSIVAGCNVILKPFISRSFTSINIIGKSGRCNAFDESADGFVRSEGVVVLILKRLSLAIKDGNQIYSVIKGSSSNVDGSLNKSNFFAPSKDSQIKNIKSAFKSTNGSIKYEDIDFFELHGTGTQVGDPIEVEAVSKVFDQIKKEPLLIGSVKPNIGHLEPASGVASLAKVCLMFKHRQFVKNIHFNNPNPNIKFKDWNVKVVTENTPFPSDKKTSIAINSFGITGSNACLLLSEYIKPPPSSSPSSSAAKLIKLNESSKLLIPISTNSKKSLESYKSILNENINKYSNTINFNEFALFQTFSKTTKLSQRSVLIANNWEELKDQPISFSTKNNKSGNIIKDNEKNPPLIFSFCGQGPQYPKMGLELYQNEPIFKQSMDEIDLLLKKQFGYSILEKLRSIKDDDKISINELSIAQPSMFMIHISLFTLYKHWGIIPSIIVGHSFGEISAAYCSGMIDLKTACFLVYIRAVLQNKTNGLGRLLSIGLSEEQFKSQYSISYPNIEIACYNSQSSIVICGNENELLEISESLKIKQIFSTLLGSNAAFHSSKQDIIKDEVIESTKDIISKLPTITTFSTVTSNQFDENTPFDSKYIFDNIRQPVLFQQTIENIFKYIESNDLGNSIVFLELSPHPTLNYYIKEMIPNLNSDYFNGDESISLLSSLKRKTNDTVSIQATISQLYCNGYNVDFKCQFNKPHDLLLASSNSLGECSHLLPHYQWDESIYWKEGITSINTRNNGPSYNQLGYINDSTPFISYTSSIDIKEEPFQFLKDHQSRGKPLFPGCGYLDNILKIFPNQDLTISNLEFKSQFPLTEGVKQILSTNIYKSSKNEYRAIFSFKDKNGKWIQSSFGRISTIKHTESKVDKVDVDKLRSECLITTLNKEDFYKTLKKMGNISILQQFQRIEEASYGKKSCFAKISLESVSSYDNDSFFNICILDSCFQVLGALFPNPTTLIFDKVENLKFYSSNIPKSAEDRKNKLIYCYSERITMTGDSLYAKTTCFLEDGSILFHSPLVTFTSIIPYLVNQQIECPNNQLFSQCLQLKDSISESVLKNILHFDHRQQQQKSIAISTFSTFLFLKFNSKFEITINDIVDKSVDELVDSCSLYKNITKTNDIDTINNDHEYKKINLIRTIFKILKSKVSYIGQTLNTLTKEDETTMTFFSDVMINNYISDGLLNLEIYQHRLLSDFLSNLISPIVKEKIVFRILEIGCGVGELSKEINDKIDQLLNDNPLNEINIEYTFTDTDDSKAMIIIEKLSNSKSSCIFKISNLNKSLVSEQLFNPSYYDVIILSNTCSDNGNIKDIKSSIGYLNEILSPNGHLLILDSNFRQTSIDDDKKYQQWLSINYLNSKSMELNEWHNLLVNELHFNDFISLSGEIEPYLIQVQKPNLSSSIKNIKHADFNYDQVIIFGGDNSNDIVREEISKYVTNVKRIYSFEEFENHVELNQLTENSLILFIESINQLSIDNFNQVSLNYIKINQYLLRNEIGGCKHILLSKNINFESSNYLASPLAGSFRYFCEFDQLNIYSLEFDDNSSYLKGNHLLFNIIQELSNSKKHIQREYIIRNDNVYYERIKLESNLKLKYKSNSYVENKNELVAKLNTDLTFRLEALPQLESNFVEIKVMAAGINFKDNLVYRRLIAMENSNQNGDPTKPQFGYEMSGVVVRVGDKVTKFKVGDHVMGTGFHCCSSIVQIDQERIAIKPNNISWAEAAISLIYITSYSCLFELGKLDLYQSTETVLIHSGTGGIGLSCIDFLKLYDFKGFLFVTVSSEEKKQYLIDRYGDFITAIYSSKNTDYEYLIKSKILELTGSQTNYILPQHHVDLIINSLPGEFLDANFNCLSQGGRIVDISITHMTTTDTTDFYKFKNFIGYTSYESLIAGFRKNKHVLKILVDHLASGKLKPVPILEFPVEKIKEAIECQGDRKHIGKIVVNFSTSNDLVNDTIIKSDNQFLKNHLFQLPNYKIHENHLGKTILITGQTGLSKTIIDWIKLYRSNSIETIIVLSKSPIKYELELIIGNLKFSGSNLNIYFKQADVSNEESLSKAIKELFDENKNISPIESIFHNAFAPAECEALDIDMNHLNVSHSAKSFGALNLHKLSLNWPIKQFILSSSVTSILGSQRQCGYVASNNLIDALSRYRKSLNLPSISINWGLLEHNGYVARNEAVSKLFELQGLIPISMDSVWGTLDLLLQNQEQSTNKMISSFEYYSTSKTYENHKLYYKLDYFLNPIKSKELITDENEISIKQGIINKFAGLLSIDSDKLNLDIKVIDYGADSLLVVEVKNWCDKSFAPNILSITQIQNSTINQIINSVSSKMRNKTKK
ncbi:hypothetical protein RB653_003451 [Dictyostelium firmibasis]|uniref:Carrier domain-containing protein n=1 Tax=Dictyostelium firmibasis TaxID=79012 RepID=A0AAN7YX07_9MYCE